MERKIIWHCACGRDFEIDNELRPEGCPFCKGWQIERVVVKGRFSRLGDAVRKEQRSRGWR
ncbi:MAG: hypothetical protein LUQ09_06655 [Methanomassiliicoccales archaeon]|nr:hypothetical protein [Methanomassiliicoccales archaeon]